MRKPISAALLLAASLTVAGCGSDMAIRLTATPSVPLVDTFFFQSWQSMQFCGMGAREGDPILGETGWMVTVASQLPNVQRMVFLIDASSAAPGTSELEMEDEYAGMVVQAQATGIDIVLGKPLGYSDNDPLVLYIRQTVAKAQNVGIHYWDTDDAGITKGEIVQGAGCSALVKSYNTFNTEAVQ